MDYADLVVIDLSKMSTPEGVAELTTQARDAMRDVGFFYVINHGLTLDQVRPQPAFLAQRLSTQNIDPAHD